MSVWILLRDAFLVLLRALPMVVPRTFLVFDLVLLTGNGGGAWSGVVSMGLFGTLGVASG